MEDLHYESYGTGEPLVLLHGFGANLATWKRLVPYLQDAYRLVLVDLKGFGRSPAPRDGCYSTHDHAENICRFLEKNDLAGAPLIGNSMGGLVALHTASLLQKKGTAPKKLVLIDSAAYRQWPPWYLLLLAIPGLDHFAFFVRKKITVQNIMRLAYYDATKIGADMVRAYAEPLAQADHRYALRRTARQMLPPAAARLDAQYAKLDIPVLLLWGRNDRLVPLTIGQRLHRVLPRSSLVVFDRCGHAPQEELPEETAAAIRTFLEDHH